MSNDRVKGGDGGTLERLRDTIRLLEAERSELHQKLERAAMIEAIATTAQGIAHDMNNVLGSIMGLASLLKLDIEPSCQMAKDVEAIEETCLRGRDLMQRLMELAKRRPTHHGPIELNALVTSATHRFKKRLPNDVEFQLALSPKVGMITGDGDQLQHVIDCLCRNAVESLATGGQVVVATASVELEASDLKGSPWLRPGPFMRFAVSDNGDGMAPETLGQICKPFFTTREGHDGLGLTLVYWVAKNHGGRLVIETDPGEGTAVTVDLPATQ